MIYYRNRTRFQELIDEDKFKILTSKIYLASPLKLKISLKNIDKQAPYPCVYLEGVIYIDKAVTRDLHLSKLLAEEFRLEDAADTIENILGANDDDELKERMEEYPELEGKPRTHLINFDQPVEVADEPVEVADEPVEVADEPVEVADSEGGRERSSSSSNLTKPKQTSGKQYRKKGIYVSQFKNSEHKGNHTRDQDEINKVDDAAMDAAMKEERDSGYSPERQSHFNPGFDIISTKDTETRYIEVKGSKNPWGNLGVELSKMQMNYANKMGDAYWVYVVENALHAPKIYKIQNVQKLIDIYRFDGTWKQVDEDDKSNDFEVGAIIENGNRKGVLKNWEPYGELVRLFIQYKDAPNVVAKEVWNPAIMSLKNLDDSDIDT